MKKDITKIMIGTAQWGLDYGISNSEGKTKKKEIVSILKYAQESGIYALDTANAYGNAEKTIGKLASNTMKVTTKITIGNQDRDPKIITQEIERKITDSGKNLGKNLLEGVLIHDPENIKIEKECISWKVLNDMKKSDIIKKIGISVYNPTQAERLSKEMKPDIIQLPLNVFDQRALSFGTINNLKEQGVEVHVRSIFLQGLLLMKPEKVDEYFEPWLNKLKHWHQYCKKKGLTPLEASLKYVFMESNIDKYIIGIANKLQLEEITKKIGSLKKDVYLKQFSSREEKLINPFKWRLNGTN